MKQEPIFLSPVFKERIWGGTKLKDAYGYSIPNDKTGECWAISAHPNGQSIVAKGEFAGFSLGDLWTSRPDLFGRGGGGTNGSKNGAEGCTTFPLLTKILDANMDLSVQVHPDDAYAMVHENGERGKTECWYIIDCDKNAEIIYGHKAANKEEFQQMVEQGEWEKLLRSVPIHPGDFIYVPSGTIHALRAGTLVLETQQSSDTTYRVYDYDRTDASGNKRGLHIEKAIDVTRFPHVDPVFARACHQTDGLEITAFVENEFFCVYKWKLNGKAEYRKALDFLLVSVIEGSGMIVTRDGEFEFHKGDHFIVPFAMDAFQLVGESMCVVSGVKCSNKISIFEG